MKQLSIALLHLLPFLALADESNSYVLDFRSNGTLSIVFEAGLRPKNVAQSPAFRCAVANVDVIFLAPEDLRLEAKDVDLEISVLRNDALSYCGAVSREMYTVEEARTLLYKALNEIGGPTTRIDSILADIALNPLTHHHLGAGQDVKLPGGARIYVGIRKTYNEDRPIRLAYGLDWPVNVRAIGFHDSPIKPPKGWEHISMDPEPYVFPTNKPALTNRPVVPRTIPTNVDMRGFIRDWPGSVEAYENPKPRKNASRKWLYIGGSSFAFLILAFLLRRKLRSK